MAAFFAKPLKGLYSKAIVYGAGDKPKVPEKLEICGLHYAVSGSQILKRVDATGKEGLLTGVVGPSGAGKSTLLRTINRLIEPSSGEVYLNGIPTSTLDPLDLRRRVGMVFQLPALFGQTVEQAISYGPRLYGKQANVRGLLEMVGLEASLGERSPESLSVGQQQRVSVARALALEPEVLLMDEPTSALDEKARRQVEDLIQDLNRRTGLTIVLVSHDLEQIERRADEVMLIVSGKSAGQWSSEEFFAGGADEIVERFVSGSL